jgi:Tfp pilus assembly protein PilX
MNASCRDQRGSVLVIAVIAMLIMGILSFSFAMLARLEMTTGFNYKAQGQAEALAEGGLERGRDAVRTAASEPCGFTRWTDAANSGSYTGCGAGLVQLLFNGVGLGAGDYSAVIDNDCSPLVPVSIQDSSCTGGSPARDTNETAVVTAWATAASGQGRARVRAVLGVDTPWKYVCSSSSQDNPPGYCNEPANRNGNPLISPADPNEYPGGPAAYDDLPRPQLGCSAIDPIVHGATAVLCAGLPHPNYNSYPYPTGVRLVVTGDRAKANCDAGGLQYQGYFDCALSTPCPAGICGSSGPVLTRKGCLKPGDTRASNTNQYVVAPCGSHTGMVFRGTSPPDTDYGSSVSPVVIYVMRGTVPPWTNAGCCDFQIQNNDFYGTTVIEGNGQGGCSGGGRDLHHRNGARAFTHTNAYGYPLAYLIFDPVAAVNNAPQPTANPLNQQDTCADMGSASGTEIHGIVYSGGNVDFNPIVVDGGVVAFQIQTQGSSSSYTYNPTYGNVTPPPGFPEGSGNTVVLVRKSFIVCVNYAADTGGGSPCQ